MQLTRVIVNHLTIRLFAQEEDAQTEAKSLTKALRAPCREVQVSLGWIVQNLETEGLFDYNGQLPSSVKLKDLK